MRLSLAEKPSTKKVHTGAAAKEDMNKNSLSKTRQSSNQEAPKV